MSSPLSLSIYSLTACILQVSQNVYLKACLPRFVSYPLATGPVCIGANLANHHTGFFTDDLSGTAAHGPGLGLTSPASSEGGCTLKPEYEDKDPFTSPGVKLASEQKLSATASTFQPYSVRLNHGSMHSLAGNKGAPTI